MFCNCLMAMLLILSYSSSTLVMLTVYMYPENNQDDAAAGLGTCSVAHSRCISPAAMYHCICGVNFHTWSSSPFNITYALRRRDKIHHVKGCAVLKTLTKTKISTDPNQLLRAKYNPPHGPLTRVCAKSSSYSGFPYSAVSSEDSLLPS